MTQKPKATDVSIDLWGGIFQSDNRGFYAALEFFALAGSLAKEDIDQDELQARLETQFEITVPGHILARRFAFDTDLPMKREAPERAPEEFIEPDLMELTRHLLQGLRVRIPGQGVDAKSWHGSHFVPYGDGLTHWDARLKHGKPLKERIYFRGAGTLAFKILCYDTNRERFQETIQALGQLLGRKHFLGHMLDLFNKNDTPRSRDPVSDIGVLKSSRVTPDDQWNELLRHCVHAISIRHDVPGVVRLDALFHILPLVLIVLQLGRSAQRLKAMGDTSLAIPLPILVDCSPADSGTGEVRQAAHRSFTLAEKVISTSLRSIAEEKGGGLEAGPQRQFRSWFTRGAPAIGLVNATTGIRRFVLQPGLLEALVLATGQKEVTFEDFVERWLHDRFGFVIDAQAARLHGLDQESDMSVFEDNAKYLADTLSSLGLMQNYSDATRMVRYGC